MILVAIFIALIFLHSLVSARMERTIMTAPIVFAAAGMMVALMIPGSQPGHGGAELFLGVAEIGLVLLLFTDASRTNLGFLNSIRT
jgi:hypothetical protein